MAEEKSESPELRGSPTPGCLILAAIIIVFGGLVVLYVVVGSIQNKKIDEFTQNEPAKLEAIVASDERTAATSAKLKQIEKAVSAGRSERITLPLRTSIFSSRRSRWQKIFGEILLLNPLIPTGFLPTWRSRFAKGLSRKDFAI